MTNEELRSWARSIQRNSGSVPRAILVLFDDRDALSARLAEVQKELDELRDWRMDVTVALGREGGAHYADVAQHVRELRRRADEKAALVEELIAHPYGEASPREVVPACPRCGNWKDQIYQDGIPTYCSTCESGYEEPAYWQRVSKP